MQKKTQRFDPRQNMNGTTYEIFHYLDAKTRHLDAHYHDFYEIFFFLEGDVDYWVDGNLYHLESGDILLINPTELHKPIQRTEYEKYERIVLWINKNYLSNIENGIFKECFNLNNPSHNKILRLNSSDKNLVFSLAKKLVNEYYSDEFANKLYSYGLLLQLLVVINRISKSSNISKEKYSTATFISDIVTYINEHYSEKLSLDSLAAHFYINKYYLSHEFKNTVGTSLYRYITLKRLNTAYSYLSEGTSAAETAALCGFSDYTSFFRAFKAEFGISPTCCGKN